MFCVNRKSWQMRLPWRQPGVGGQNWHHALPTVNVQQGWLNIYRGVSSECLDRVKKGIPHKRNKGVVGKIYIKVKNILINCYYIKI